MSSLVRNIFSLLDRDFWTQDSTIKTERVVPYTDGVKIGDLYDGRKCDISKDCAHKFGETNMTVELVNKLESKFSLTESIDDMCDVLKIPKEYALKVWTGHIFKEGVKRLLLALHVPHSKTLIVRKTYVKKRVSVPDRDKSLEVRFQDLKPSQHENHPTHWVKSIDIGEEIVVILNFVGRDSKVIQNIHENIDKMLGSSHADLDSIKQRKLTECLTNIDQSLMNGYMQGIEYRILVFGFHKYYASSLKDVITLLDRFDKQEEVWRQVKYYRTKKDKMTFFESDAFQAHHTDLKMQEGQFYNLRMTVKTLPTDNAHQLQLDSHEAKEYYNLLLAIYNNYPKSLQKLQSFLERQEFSFMSEDARKLMEIIEQHGLNATSTIADLDLRCIDRLHLTKLKAMYDVVKTVDDFIKRKTEQLPSGPPIQLILLGKTGHGKSSTGNSILRKKVFVTSTNTSSETATASCNSATIDSRLITCVDTPGVYDTSSDKESDIYSEVTKAIGLGITHCSQGFHAIILVFSYPFRMSAEEKMCIEMITSLFGKDILGTHVIIIITKGDDYKTKNESFYKWLKGKQDDYFKGLLMACNYRCVLFDNNTDDEKALKEQLVLLINHIDSLGGTPYTNAMFEKAEKMRAQYFIDSIYLNNVLTSSCISVFEELKNTKKDSTVSPDINKQINNIFNMLGNPKLETPTYKLFTAIKTVGNEFAVKAKTGEKLSKNDKTVKMLSSCLKNTVDEIIKVDQIVASKLESSIKCFPGCSVVYLEKGEVCLGNIKIGMKVLAFDKNKGLFYDEIYMFGHQQRNAVSKFVDIHTESHQISISPEHLILCKKNDSESFVAAKTVSVGDEILTKSDSGFVWSSVADVTYRVDRGLYAPFTRSGTIVVDGVVASCYIDVLPHDMCHRMVSPIRCLYRVSPSLVRRVGGVSDTQPVPKIARLVLTILEYGKKMNDKWQTAGIKISLPGNNRNLVE